jgi:hypothetical protein
MMQELPHISTSFVLLLRTYWYFLMAPHLGAPYEKLTVTKILMRKYNMVPCTIVEDIHPSLPPMPIMSNVPSSTANIGLRGIKD